MHTHNTQPCRIYIHPALAARPDQLAAVVKRTGLALAWRKRVPVSTPPFGGDAA